jgi:hypothetical protein
MGTHWEQKINIPTLLQKKKTSDPLGLAFLRWRIFSIEQFFFPKNLLNISFFSEKSPTSNKKIFEITMFSHIVQQIAMI